MSISCVVTGIWSGWRYCKCRNFRSVLGARKYDVSEKMNHYSANRSNCLMRENLSTRIYQQRLGVRKFRCAKISTFTVVEHGGSRPRYKPVGVSNGGFQYCDYNLTIVYIDLTSYFTE